MSTVVVCLQTSEEFRDNYLSEPLDLELWKSRISALHERDPHYQASSSVDWRKEGYVTNVSELHKVFHVSMKKAPKDSSILNCGFINITVTITTVR